MTEPLAAAAASKPQPSSSPSPSAVRTDIVERLMAVVRRIDVWLDRVSESGGVAPNPREIAEADLAREAASEITRLRSERDEDARGWLKVMSEGCVNPEHRKEFMSLDEFNRRTAPKAVICALCYSELRSANSLLIAVAEAARKVAFTDEKNPATVDEAFLHIGRLVERISTLHHVIAAYDAALSVSPTQKEEK